MKIEIGQEVKTTKGIGRVVEVVSPEIAQQVLGINKLVFQVVLHKDSSWVIVTEKQIKGVMG